MPGKVLRRCDLCKKFHASYAVQDALLGVRYLCYRCWLATQAPSTQPASAANRKAEGVGGPR
jgi:hypothetical protein